MTSSPAMTACCTGAAPRQAGSSEKCRLTQPCRGMSSARLRDQRAVGHHRAGVGRELAQPVEEVGVARTVGRQHLDAELLGALAHRRLHDAPAAAGAGIRAGDDGHHLVR